MTWRVMTWNIRGSARPDPDRIAEVIAGQQPDVVALQEVRRGQARALAAALGWRHVWTRKHYPYTPLAWWTAEGLAILSPHPLESTTSRSLTPGTSTWTYRHRVVLIATVRRGEESLRVHDTHLAAHHQPDARIDQAGRIASIIGDESVPVIVAGDLNADGEVEVIRPFHAVGLRDAGSGPTHPSTSPRRRFDYVLVPARATVVDAHVPDGGDAWRELSDHLPLTVELVPG
ncbi:MAG: endonuclease/exonuclease/phosphatase family protein [Ilumatobacteraceae bacterium]